MMRGATSCAAADHEAFVLGQARLAARGLASTLFSAEYSAMQDCWCPGAQGASVGCDEHAMHICFLLEQ
jgi:hypothetical protein